MFDYVKVKNVHNISYNYAEKINKILTLYINRRRRKLSIDVSFSFYKEDLLY